MAIECVLELTPQCDPLVLHGTVKAVTFVSRAIALEYKRRRKYFHLTRTTVSLLSSSLEITPHKMDLLRREQLLSLTLRRSPYDYTKLYLCGFLAVPARKTILDFLVLHRCPRPAEVVHCTTSPGNEICV